MDIQQYLNRIGYDGQLDCTAQVLSNLHHRHVLSIAFENIDVQNQVPIILNIDSLYNKVITCRRGGFCYELNYLFYSLLTKLGFDVDIVSSRIYNKLGIIGPEFDHMSLIVRLEDRWLVDVGYGDLFLRPIRIVEEAIQGDFGGNFKISKRDNSTYLLSASKTKDDFHKKYQFSTTPRVIEDFSEQCCFKQSSPDSYFVQNFICTLPTCSGRKTILNDTFKTFNGSEKIMQEIMSCEAKKALIAEEFKIEYA